MPQDETDDNIELDTSTDSEDSSTSLGDGDEQGSQPDERDDSDSQSEDSGLLDTLTDAVDKNNQSSPASDPSETAETKHQGDEDEGEEAGEPHIPYSRFREVVAQRNKLRSDADAMQQLRKGYEDAGLPVDVLATFAQLGIALKRDPAAAAAQIEQLAKIAGLRVETDIPADLQPFVDSGELDREAAVKIAASRRPDKVEMPDKFDLRGSYSSQAGMEDIKEIAQDYEARYPDIFKDPEIAKEAQEALAMKLKEIKELSGVDPTPDKWGVLADRACKEVLGKHRQPVKRPVDKPLRSSKQPQPHSVKSYNNLNDFVRFGLKDI